ncbi:MAG: FliG C-terminal domain-containing protein [Planctomycetota bacterium]
MTSIVDELNPAQRIAALLLSIDRDASVGVLKEFTDDIRDTVLRAMKELRDVPIDAAALQQIYEEFADRTVSGDSVLGDAGSQMKHLLNTAYDRDTAKRLEDDADRGIVAKRPFAMFETLPPEDLAALISDEHPQIAAVFLARLAPKRAAKVVEAMPEERQVSLLRRVATLERTPPEVVQSVFEVLREKVRELGLVTLRFEPRATEKTVADILLSMREDGDIMFCLRAEDPQLAARIEEEMFKFEDLATLDKRSMQKVLAEVQTTTLATALKASAPAIDLNIAQNLSRRAWDMVQEERNDLGPVPLSEVDEAQQQILKTIRRMIEQGELRLGEVEEEVL